MARCNISLGTRGLSMCPSTGWQPFIFLMQFTKKKHQYQRQPSRHLIDYKARRGLLPGRWRRGEWPDREGKSKGQEHKCGLQVFICIHPLIFRKIEVRFKLHKCNFQFSLWRRGLCSGAAYRGAPHHQGEFKQWNCHISRSQFNAQDVLYISKKSFYCLVILLCANPIPS